MIVMCDICGRKAEGEEGDVCVAMSAEFEALRKAEDAVREINKVARELRRIEHEGLPYNGPEIEWQSTKLGATRPEPHIALSLEYREDNDLDVDIEYLASLAGAVAFEAGYRERVLDEAVDQL